MVLYAQRISANDELLHCRDNVPHTYDPAPDFAVIFNTVSNITGELRTAFPDYVPILPVLGNHDAYPKVGCDLLTH